MRVCVESVMENVEQSGRVFWHPGRSPSNHKGAAISEVRFIKTNHLRIAWIAKSALGSQLRLKKYNNHTSVVLKLKWKFAVLVMSLLLV